MGIIQLPDIESFWKTSWVCNVQFFHDVLPRDRFQEIFWLLHVGLAGNTPRKIDKIKPLLDVLIARFQELYRPSKHLSIDETIVGFRGRFGSTQYMPQKPTKWGIKAFLLADEAKRLFAKLHCVHWSPDSRSCQCSLFNFATACTCSDGTDGPTVPPQRVSSVHRQVHVNKYILQYVSKKCFTHLCVYTATQRYDHKRTHMQDGFTRLIPQLRRVQKGRTHAISQRYPARHTQHVFNAH